MRATWKPHEKHGRLTRRSDLPDSVFAFPHERKEPLTDARHVRNAVARFDQVTDVPQSERELAFANIKKAAKHYDVDLSEADWHELGIHPQRHRKAASRKATATKKRTGVAKSAARKAAATRAKRKTPSRKKSTSRK